MSSRKRDKAVSEGTNPRLVSASTVEDEIRGALRLGGRVNQKLAIIAKLFEPAGNVGGLILENRRRDSGFRTQIRGGHFRDEFFGGICRRTERRGFRDRSAVEPLRMPYCVRCLVLGSVPDVYVVS